MRIFSLLHFGCWVGILLELSAGRAVSLEIQNYNLLCFGSRRALQAFSSLQRNTALQANPTQTFSAASELLCTAERALQQQIWVTHPTKDTQLQMTSVRVLSVVEEEAKISF